MRGTTEQIGNANGFLAPARVERTPRRAQRGVAGPPQRSAARWSAAPHGWVCRAGERRRGRWAVGYQGLAKQREGCGMSHWAIIRGWWEM